jgi:DNA-binding MarR family transcriptional regulator
VARRRSEADRRVVTTVVTAQGLELLAKLDEPIVESARKMFAHMNPKDLKLALSLLEDMRDGETAP